MYMFKNKKSKIPIKTFLYLMYIVYTQKNFNNTLQCRLLSIKYRNLHTYVYELSNKFFLFTYIFQFTSSPNLSDFVTPLDIIYADEKDF